MIVKIEWPCFVECKVCVKIIVEVTSLTDDKICEEKILHLL